MKIREPLTLSTPERSRTTECGYKFFFQARSVPLTPMNLCGAITAVSRGVSSPPGELSDVQSLKLATYFLQSAHSFEKGLLLKIRIIELDLGAADLLK